AAQAPEFRDVLRVEFDVEIDHRAITSEACGGIPSGSGNATRRPKPSAGGHALDDGSGRDDAELSDALPEGFLHAGPPLDLEVRPTRENPDDTTLGICTV